MYLIAHERRFADAQVYQPGSRLPLHERYKRVLRRAVERDVQTIQNAPPEDSAAEQLSAFCQPTGTDFDESSVPAVFSIDTPTPSPVPESPTMAPLASSALVPRSCLLEPMTDPVQVALSPLEPRRTSRGGGDLGNHASTLPHVTEKTADVISIDSEYSMSGSEDLATQTSLDYSYNQNIIRTLRRASDFTTGWQSSATNTPPSLQGPDDSTGQLLPGLVSPRTGSMPADSKSRAFVPLRRRVRDDNGKKRDHSRSRSPPQKGPRNPSGAPQRPLYLLPPLTPNYQSSDQSRNARTPREVQSLAAFDNRQFPSITSQFKPLPDEKSPAGGGSPDGGQRLPLLYASECSSQHRAGSQERGRADGDIHSPARKRVRFDTRQI